MIIIYILLGIIVALLLISLIMPKTYNVEKNIIISKPVGEVKGKIADLNYYRQWNPWQQMEPSSSQTITGTPGTAGHKYAWKGKKIGEGSLTLLSQDDKHIHFDLEFLKPWKAQAKDNWLFEQWGNGGETKVTWQNSGALPWPMARLMGPLLTKNLNYQFSKGLDNLKKMCEEGEGA